MVLFDSDVAVDNKRQPEPGDFQGHGGLEWPAIQLAGRIRNLQGLLDFALRGNPDLFKELAYFHVDDVFVHDTPPVKQPV